MSDDTGLAEALLGLDGFMVLDVTETEAEVTIRIETSATVVACDGCGLRAEAQGRTVVQYRDLAAFGRPCSVGVAQAPGGVVPNRAVTPGLGRRPMGRSRRGVC